MILVLNCGSQSIKWKLFSENLKKVKDGKVEVLDEKEYGDFLLKELEGLAEYKEKIKIVGHRVVHSGGKYKSLIVLDDDVLMGLEKFSQLAPLHNPYNILGAKTAERVFLEAKQIAVFDTDFFSNLPETASSYALPKDIIEKYGFRRFGFHGISHEYVASEAAKKIGKPLNKLKVITCHLGGGASITAIENGKAIDTSMGFTPMEGLVMMTRSGSIDPGIVLKLAEELSVAKTEEVLNKNSGVAGICRTGEMLDVLEKIKRGDKSARLALDIFVYSIKKYIGAYFAILGGCDLLVFTGAIGSGSSKIRNMICKDLNILKQTKILAIKTDEELAIAQKIIKIKKT
jgi:acetate kinase